MEGIGVQFALFGLGMLVLYLTLVRPRRGLPGARPPAPSEREQSRQVRDDLDEIFVQIQEFSRETIGKLDTKIRILNQLVLDADARIRRLEELQGEARPAADSKASAAPAPPSPAPPPPVPPLHARVYDLHDRGLTLPEIEAETGLPKGEVELILGMRGLGRGGTSARS